MRTRNNERERRKGNPYAELEQVKDADGLFGPACWVWTTDERNNQYAAFIRTVDLPVRVDSIQVRISASYHYEFFINGDFANRGPVHGDPEWCHYDDLTIELDTPSDQLDILVLVHHPTGTHIHCLTPAPGGLICRIAAGPVVVGTDSTWHCKVLPMWNNDVRPRNWALGYCEDYDARLEPPGWGERHIGAAERESWPAAEPVADAERIWSGYQPRSTPLIGRRAIAPEWFTAWRAPGTGAESVFEISNYCDREKLVSIAEHVAFTIDRVNELLVEANAFTLDLGAEYTGFYSIDLEAPAETVIEISGAELLQNAEKSDAQSRPWIFRKGTCYSTRYTCHSGRQSFTSFSWNGFRYLHLVIRNRQNTGSATGGDRAGHGPLRFHAIRAVERRPDMTPCHPITPEDRELAHIVRLCERTLLASSMEHVVDCPTREQAPAFLDGLIASAALLRGFGEPSYLLWHLEALLQAPLNEHHQFCGRYPSTRGYWLDFCLVAFQAQRHYHDATGSYYKPAETLKRGLQVKIWFDNECNDDGIIDFPFNEYYNEGLRNFIDHPGLGLHDSPHVGIDRDGASCPLNIHFYAFLRILAAIAEEAGDVSAGSALSRQADNLRGAIRRWFFDGQVFHDARKDGQISPYTSWQTNGMAVYFDVANAGERSGIMQRMLDGYNRLCRCTPGNHYYFLPALEKAGFHNEAIALIKTEWGRMIQRGATTAWEGFEGDAKDSLCHPWASTPLLFLLEASATPAS